MQTLVESNDCFRIAETDLKLRGPGDLMGTQQSGALDLIISDLATDGDILNLARNAAVDLLKIDPLLRAPENHILKITSLHLIKVQSIGVRSANFQPY